MKLAFSVTEPFLQILAICKKNMLNHNSRITESFLLISAVTITHLFANFNPVVQNNRNILTHLEFFHCPNIRRFFRNLTPDFKKRGKSGGAGNKGLFCFSHAPYRFAFSCGFHALACLARAVPCCRLILCFSCAILPAKKAG